MKPTRIFTADEGENSVGLGGPDSIEKDIDSINTMFDPLSKHTDDSSGGIGPENIQDDAVETKHLKNKSVTDEKVGDRAIDENIDDEIADTGPITKLFSWIGKLIKSITGESSWKVTPVDSLKGLDTRVNNVYTKSDIDNMQFQTHNYADGSVTLDKLNEKVKKTVSDTVLNARVEVIEEKIPMIEKKINIDLKETMSKLKDSETINIMGGF